MSSPQATPAIVSVISGGIAGGVEAAATYPFEFAKTRAQLASVDPSRNPFSVVAEIYQKEGVRALYKGCSALIVGSVAKDAVRFLSFDTIKNAFADPETGALSIGGNMLAGMSAGVLASIFAVTPTERIKTALIDDAKTLKRFRSARQAIRTIVQEDGLVGLYRGFAGTTLKQISSTGFRMGSYNTIKEYEKTHNIPQNTAMNFANGAVAGTVTTLATMPFDTVKTRSQAAKATTTLQAVVSVWRDGGIKGFWRGTVMRLGRTVFAGGILFTTAEAVAKILNPLFAKEK